MLLAKGSKMIKDPSAKKRVATAAIYATDRALLKKYISGNLLFLTEPPEQKSKKAKASKPAEEEAPTEEQAAVHQHRPPREKYKFPKPKESKEPEPEPDELEGKIIIPGIPEGALDGILDELEQDMEDLKSSRMKFADLQQQIEEEDAVSAALEKATSFEPAEIQNEETPDSAKQESKVEPPVLENQDPIAESEEALPTEEPSVSTEEQTPTPIAEEPEEETKAEETAEAPKQTNKPSKATEDGIISNLDGVSDFDDEEEDLIEAREEDFDKHPVISNFSDDDDDEVDDLIISDFKSEVEGEIEITAPTKSDSSKEEPVKAEPIEKKPSEEEIESVGKVEESEENIQVEEKKQEEKSEVKAAKDKKEDRKTEKNKITATPEEKAQVEGTSQTVRLESEIKREERRERRANRGKRLSSLSELSESNLTESNLKELENQMWGDEEESTKEKETEKPTKTSEKEESSIKEAEKVKKKVVAKKPKKSTTKASSKTTAKKSTSAAKPAKKATTKPSTKKATKSSTTKSTTKTKKSTTKKKDDDDGKGHPARDQEQIIDKFIEKSPSISKPDKTAKHDKDLSDQSSEWNKELASEYLAEIYLQQGNKKRAIDIYQTLSLNFPEKKSYFADLISKIK